MINFKINPTLHIAFGSIRSNRVSLCDWVGIFFMKEIPLPNGQKVKVDDEDFDFLNRWRWRLAGSSIKYVVRSIRNGSRTAIVTMHRVIMNVSDSNVLIDHKDHDPLNNQKYNLRTCNKSQNNANSVKKKGTSKYRGVFKTTRKRGIVYLANIYKNGIAQNLGVFDSEIDAAIAYDKAAIELHGEFANINFK